MPSLPRAIAVRRKHRTPFEVQASDLSTVSPAKEQAMYRNSNPTHFERNRIMTKSLNVALAVLIGGAASFAYAQSPKEAFANAFADMQSLSSNSSNWQREAPTFSKAPRERSAGLSIREMQALSSDSPVWEIDRGKIEVDHGPTFAQTHPHGLSFSQYQAYASNSDEFAPPRTVDISSIAATDPVSVAGDAAKVTLHDRIANFLHRGGPSNTSDAK